MFCICSIVSIPDRDFSGLRVGPDTTVEITLDRSLVSIPDRDFSGLRVTLKCGNTLISIVSIPDRDFSGLRAPFHLLAQIVPGFNP